MTQAPAIWMNLDFEYELRHGASWRASEATRRVLARWRALLRCIPGYETAVCLDEPPDEPNNELLCWGDSPRALRAMGCADVVARAEAARLANDRGTLFDLEPASAKLPYAELVTSLEGLERAIASTPCGWVLKHPLGVSGRERQVGRRGELDARARRWAERAMERSSVALSFEPRATLKEEFSWHFHVTSPKSITTLGRCTLLTDAQGTHRGHLLDLRASSAASEHEPPPQIVKTLGAISARTGYRGPLSTDGFVGHLRDEPIAREISEVNARFTFGRVALELKRSIPAVWDVMAWWHPARSAATKPLRDLPELDEEKIEASDSGWRRLPDRIDPGAESATAVYLTRGREAEALLKLCGEALSARLSALWDAL